MSEQGMVLTDNYIPTRPGWYDGSMLGQLSTVSTPQGKLLRKPYFNDQGHRCVLFNHRGRHTTEKGVKTRVYEETRVRDLRNDYDIDLPTWNATTLRKEEWIELDRTVLRAARYRLRAWADLAAANSYGGFNGMNKTMLEHETMSDPMEAFVDMDGLSEGRSDRPRHQLEGMPLPITHTDFWFGARELGISRNTGTPLDVNGGEAAGRRIGETIEKTTIGNVTGMTYGGNSTQVGGYGRTSAVYGYLNFPNRITKTGLYRPTGSGSSGAGWKPQDTLNDVLGLVDIIKLNKFFGSWMLYTSNDWDKYLDNDYQVFTVGGSNYGGSMSLRDRLRRIEGIQDVRRLDMLFSATSTTSFTGSSVALSTRGPGLESLNNTYPFTMILVQMTQDVAQAVNGMDITTLQWESVGGLRQNFKVMCIQAARLRCDFYGNCGILQASFDT